MKTKEKTKEWFSFTSRKWFTKETNDFEYMQFYDKMNCETAEEGRISQLIIKNNGERKVRIILEKYEIDKREYPSRGYKEFIPTLGIELTHEELVDLIDSLVVLEEIFIEAGTK